MFTLLAIAFGYIFGLDGILGFSLLAVMIAFTNSNGGLWIALAAQYGDDEDRRADIASALNDGPFFAFSLGGRQPGGNSFGRRGSGPPFRDLYGCRLRANRGPCVRLSLDRTGGHAPHQISVPKNKQHEGHDEGQHRSGHRSAKI